MLTDADVKKMQNLYRKYDIDVDSEVARKQLNKLVRQMAVIYRPITASQLKALQDEDNKANEGNDNGSRRPPVI